MKYYRIFKWFMILFSGYVLYIMLGILLNSSVCLTYESASINDIQYVNTISKVIILYILCVLVFLFVSSSRKT